MVLDIYQEQVHKWSLSKTKAVITGAGAAFIITNTATAMAAISWMFTEWIHTKKPTVLGLASGAVAVLVAITPAPLSMGKEIEMETK